MALTTGRTTVSWKYVYPTSNCDGYDALSGPSYVAPFGGGTTATTTTAPSVGTVLATIAVSSNPMSISSDGTHVWAANLFDYTVSEILR